MNRMKGFIRRERLYILILIFVVIFNIIMFLYPGKKARPEKIKKAAAAQMLFSRQSKMEEVLRKNERLVMMFSLATLLIFTIFVLGIIMDMILVSVILRKKLDIRSLSPPPARWNVWDVCKVIILFLFFGYIVVISEAFWSRIFPIFKAGNFRMIINTSFLDLLAVVLVMYFTVIQYKEDIKALGISVNNFFRNVFYGIVGYIALVPVLILILAITVIVINITKYVPQRQPVVELFLKETNPTFLTYSSLFAAVVGPIIEELFFRGFMYGALKKYIGIPWSMVLTAAIFAALHTQIVGFLPILALGLLLAYLYEKTGTLVASITVHTIHNLGMVFLVLLIKQTGVG